MSDILKKAHEYAKQGDKSVERAFIAGAQMGIKAESDLRMKVYLAEQELILSEIDDRSQMIDDLFNPVRAVS